MEKLVKYINKQPNKKIAHWAVVFGISRPFLYNLLDGDREPSIEVAMRIEAETSGEVPVSSWENHRRVMAAISGETSQ